MSQPKKRYSLDQYFELERNSLEKYQFLDGEIFPVGTAPLDRNTDDNAPAHQRIIENVQNELQRLMGKQQVVVSGNEARIFLSDGRSLTADVLVCQRTVRFVDEGCCWTSPRMIVEVLSDSTESYDRGKKFEHYQSIPSIQEYVLVAQDRPHVDHFIREADGSWRLRMMNGLESTLRLATVDCELAFRAIFDRVSFPPQPEPAAEA